MSYRLRPEHPVYQKFEKLCACADDIGLSLTFTSDGHIMVVDKDNTSPDYIVKDIDGDGVYEFPPNFDYKIVVET